MRALLRQFMRSDEGVTAIEFAMVSPVLIFLMLAIIEYSIVFHLQSLATHAGNEAARMGKTGADYCIAPVTKKECVEKTIRTILSAWVHEDDPLSVEATSYGKIGSGAVGVGGMGVGGELVLYETTFFWKPFTPLFFSGAVVSGPDGNEGVPIRSYSLIKNEDF